MAKKVIEDNFRATYSMMDRHAGTIVNQRPYRHDLQGYVNNCGTRWANTQLQYGTRKAGTSNTFAQVPILTQLFNSFEFDQIHVSCKQCILLFQAICTYYSKLKRPVCEVHYCKNIFFWFVALIAAFYVYSIHIASQTEFILLQFSLLHIKS